MDTSSSPPLWTVRLPPAAVTQDPPLIRPALPIVTAPPAPMSKVLPTVTVAAPTVSVPEPPERPTNRSRRLSRPPPETSRLVPAAPEMSKKPVADVTVAPLRTWTLPTEVVDVALSSAATVHVPPEKSSVPDWTSTMFSDPPPVRDWVPVPVL